MSVFVVSAIGFECEFEAVAAFSSYSNARNYVEKEGLKSWAIEELIIDEEEVSDEKL